MGTCPIAFTYYGYEDYNQVNGRIQASVNGFQYKWFATEFDLLPKIQSGPMVVNMDVAIDPITGFCPFQFYGGGVFYDEVSCTNMLDEPVPEECRRDGQFGYTCLGDCKNKLPLHCDR